MPLPSYISLRNHTPYALLQGATPIPKLVERAASYGMSALGLADPYLFGAMEFSLACQKKSLHPIIGCQLSFLDESSGSSWPLVVYAKNAQGYENLCILISATTVNQPAELRGHITLSQLTPHTSGLIALTGGPNGGVEGLLMRGYDAQAEVYLDRLCGLFKDHLYMELTRSEPAQKDALIGLSPSQWKREERVLDWAYDKGLPLVATQEVFFLDPDDYEAYDTLRCIALGHYIQDPQRPRPDPYHFLRTPQDMALLFQDVPEAIANTHHLASRCSFLLTPKKPVLPSFPCISEVDELFSEGQKGLEMRLTQEVFPLHPTSSHADIEKQYKERLTYETQMVIQMGFAGYFLIVSDFIRWAKSQSIPVGPGRGSGAGSLLAWCLSITDVDPLRFHLFFERFLNPERVSMPDFDVDFCQDRRDEVIAYVRDKYGPERVAHIITFGSLQARVVLRDVGRVLQMPYGQVDKICKLVPQNPVSPIHLAQALELEPQITLMAEEDSQVEKMLSIALKLEGLYRHASTHAAGVIIGSQPLAQIVPLYQDEVASLPATQFSMKYVEQAGLVKFDFLGLKTLTVLQTAVDLIANGGVTVILPRIPLDDARTFSLLCQVETVGLFQLESAGMSDVLRQLQPQTFEEIIALVALYRPGPMDDIPRYIACRHGREAISFAYPCLSEILKETFGVMVYQEQVLQIARVLAGYSLGGADLLRRAMGKKIQSEMDAQRKVFIDGTLANFGGTADKAAQLFDQIAKFAGYAFPKAHATPYGLLSYQTAYLKANYPVEFMTSLMIHDAAHTDKLRVLAKEVKRMGLSLLGPDINQSQALFSVASQGGIRYGLTAIKNIGPTVMQRCVEERDKHGLFVDVFNFMQRTAELGVNKKTIEALICAGAFDAIHGMDQRHGLMASVERILAHGMKTEEGNRLFQTRDAPHLTSTRPWSPYEALSHERMALGFYLTGHPLEMYRHLPVRLYDQLEKIQNTNATFLMMGMLMDWKEKVSKSGQKYAFLQLSDPTGTFEAVLFGEMLIQSRRFLEVGRPLLLRIQARLTGENLRLTVVHLQPLEEGNFPEEVRLTLKDFSHVKLLHTTLEGLDPGVTSLQCSLVLPGDPCVKILFQLDKAYKVPPEVRSRWIQMGFM